jgi:hypothetical protein
MLRSTNLADHVLYNSFNILASGLDKKHDKIM